VRTACAQSQPASGVSGRKRRFNKSKSPPRIIPRGGFLFGGGLAPVRAVRFRNKRRDAAFFGFTRQEPDHA
jgi:hypothetical protein